LKRYFVSENQRFTDEELRRYNKNLVDLVIGDLKVKNGEERSYL